MIHHHQAGVEMAQAALDRTGTGVVVDLARSIVGSQQAEIGLMQSMLQARGLPPEPLPGAGSAGATPEHAAHDRPQ
jgi:hypothetical protein